MARAFESDVSADRGAALGHETLEKRHECPLAGKSSMQWFPAIVLQPGPQISLVQVAPFPASSLSLTAPIPPFLSLSLCTWHSLPSRVISNQAKFYSALLLLSYMCDNGALDKSWVSMATAAWPDFFSWVIAEQWPLTLFTNHKPASIITYLKVFWGKKQKTKNTHTCTHT